MNEKLPFINLNKLLSSERARQVTRAQCPLAVSKAFAPSDDISLMLLSTCPPVIILLPQVMETMAELLIPKVAKASARGKCHSSELEPVGPLNMRMNVLLLELPMAFP